MTQHPPTDRDTSHGAAPPAGRSTTAPATARQVREVREVRESVARSPLLSRLGSSSSHPPVPRKPAWRGWIHAGFTPLLFVLGLIAVLLAPTPELRVACAVFGVSGLLLFGVSGVYHRSYWSPRFTGLLRRMDHCNIALLIAGTYTPLAVALLDRPAVLLVIVWGCAAGLIAFRLIWMSAPRWLYTPLYVVMGCIAAGYLPAFWPVSPAATVLVAAGGVAYIAGAVVYALRRPALNPRVFGFHEVFHSCTVLGFVCHYIAIMLALGAVS